MKVVTFNTEGAFCDPKRQDEILDFVDRVSPDIAYFSESHFVHSKVVEAEAKALRNSVNYLREDLNYNITLVGDDDTSDRVTRTGFIGVVRPELGSGSVFQAGIRKGYLGNVLDTASGEVLKVGGMHFTDQDEHSRLEHVAHLPKMDILVGDLNALERGTKIARALRAFAPVANMLPVYEKDFNDVGILDGLDFVRKCMHFGKRVIYMADGSTIDQLASKGLHTIDTQHRRTHRVVPIQIDHIMVSNEIEVKGFTIHDEVKFSDHKPLSATLFHK